MLFDRRVRAIVLGAALVVIAVLGAIVSVSTARCPGGCPPGKDSVAAVEPSVAPRVPAAVTIALDLSAKPVSTL